MVDTGAQLNILKSKALPLNKKINESRKLVLKGISNVPIQTYGEIILTIHEQPSTFQIVPDTINIPYDGIIGSQFCIDGNCKINYHTNQITINNKLVPFSKNRGRIKNSENVTCLGEERKKPMSPNEIDVSPGSPLDKIFQRDVEITRRHLEKLRKRGDLRRF